MRVLLFTLFLISLVCKALSLQPVTNVEKYENPQTKDSDYKKDRNDYTKVKPKGEGSNSGAGSDSGSGRYRKNGSGSGSGSNSGSGASSSGYEYNGRRIRFFRRYDRSSGESGGRSSYGSDSSWGGSSEENGRNRVYNYKKPVPYFSNNANDSGYGNSGEKGQGRGYASGKYNDYTWRKYWGGYGSKRNSGGRADSRDRDDNYDKEYGRENNRINRIWNLKDDIFQYY